MCDEFERIWKETVVACSSLYPGICLEGLKKTTKILSHYSRRPGQDGVDIAQSI
jgi:hypothetical protein